MRGRLAIGNCEPAAACLCAALACACTVLVQWPLQFHYARPTPTHTKQSTLTQRQSLDHLFSLSTRPTHYNVYTDSQQHNTAPKASIGHSPHPQHLEHTTYTVPALDSCLRHDSFPALGGTRVRHNCLTAPIQPSLSVTLSALHIHSLLAMSLSSWHASSPADTAAAPSSFLSLFDDDMNDLFASSTAAHSPLNASPLSPSALAVLR